MILRIFDSEKNDIGDTEDTSIFARYCETEKFFNCLMLLEMSYAFFKNLEKKGENVVDQGRHSAKKTELLVEN